jgi:hypothetical protein
LIFHIAYRHKKNDRKPPVGVFIRPLA